MHEFSDRIHKQIQEFLELGNRALTLFESHLNHLKAALDLEIRKEERLQETANLRKAKSVAVTD